MIRVTFVAPGGRERRTVEAAPGITLLRLAHLEGVDIEGACGGAMACSTCHVIFSEADFTRLAPACEEEEEMLDLAPAVTATSRLACQILLTRALDGLVVHLPPETVDARG